MMQLNIRLYQAALLADTSTQSLVVKNVFVKKCMMSFPLKVKDCLVEQSSDSFINVFPNQ